jgi:hypothetical protein
MQAKIAGHPLVSAQRSTGAVQSVHKQRSQSLAAQARHDSSKVAEEPLAPHAVPLAPAPPAFPVAPPGPPEAPAISDTGAPPLAGAAPIPPCEVVPPLDGKAPVPPFERGAAPPALGAPPEPNAPRPAELPEPAAAPFAAVCAPAPMVSGDSLALQAKSAKTAGHHAREPGLRVTRLEGPGLYDSTHIKWRVARRSGGGRCATHGFFPVSRGGRLGSS